MTRKADPQSRRLPVKVGEIPAFTPVPRKGQRHDGWTETRQRAFIEALADTGSVAAACKAVDMSQGGAYYLRRQPGAQSFRAAWHKALDLGVERLEDVAMERALNGVEEPFYVYGNHVGTRTRYNDRLLMFMLRNRAPERFGNSVTKGGGSMKGLNAIGKMEKKRLKKKWRKQWEAEQAEASRNVSPQEIRASIDRKIEVLRLQLEDERKAHWQRLSPETRRAHALFERLKARDEARMAPKGRSEDTPHVADESAQNEDVQNPPPRKRPRNPPKPRKTVHTLKDDGFEADGWI